jgi:hypothetical protein
VQGPAEDLSNAGPFCATCAAQFAREQHREIAIKFLLGEELAHVSIKWQRERDARLGAAEEFLGRRKADITTRYGVGMGVVCWLCCHSGRCCHCACVLLAFWAGQLS